ncbi:toprim domain-containing protein [Virgibacillus sp. 179-BFC.A HS]|uniref:Toprim domain-containing protein n=1 Tax=Tigheibacillus jepli TaxID=3035914 RepID=A0ABU5CMU3_9BACI|nr:toprim domain-containing protein [Virgibacillus sp. 179-BFC.A HS]MDY0407216.1 toprim domain-containing protein [Virgibacillus sp. 179-BFC.A HS]
MKIDKQSLYKRLVYQNIEDVLDELNAEDKGRYYICNCPECNEHEAFIYKNNTNFIQCNRENHCGERMLLQFHEKKSLHSEREKIQQTFPSLSDDQKEALTWSMRLFSFAKTGLKSEALDNGYRGLSKGNIRKHIVDLQNREVIQYFFRKTSSLLGKDYSKNNWMCKRNLIFPLYDKNNILDRVLLRSSIDPTLEPKEIQLIMNPSKDTKDFFMEIPEETKTVVFSESLLDALSFREVDAHCGFIALTGASKTRQVQAYICENNDVFTNKHILVAMDDDKAGWKATKKLVNTLRTEGLGENVSLFRYSDGYKDANEFLQGNRARFTKRYLQDTNQLQQTKRIQNEMPFS